MNPVLTIWLQFALCVAAIGVAGMHLSRYGDAIAALTGLSRNWIGLILVATVTSLPELVTGLSAVTVAQAPDIAAGDALGSCVFNLAILALIDLLYRRSPLYIHGSDGHLVSAAYGAVLLVGFALAMLLSAQRAIPALGHVSLASVAIMAVYATAMRAAFRVEQRHTGAGAAERPGMTLKTALMGYGLTSAVIVGAGIWLSIVGVQLAQAMGWTHSFVGTLFVAFATSVPELATTWGAVRIAAIGLAIGNLLGSNLFDLLILALDDLAYVQGPLYSSIAPAHAISALIACMMSGVVIIALVDRPQSRVWRIASWASIALFLLYFANAWMQFRQGH